MKRSFPMKKGDAPSLWLWIIGGFLLASLTLVILWQLLATAQVGFMRKAAAQEFTGLDNELSYLCSAVSPGSSRTINMKLPTVVEGIYAAPSETYIPQNLSQLVDSPLNKGGISNGKYVCLKLRGEAKAQCNHFECTIVTDYLGASPKDSFFDQLRQLASSPTFNYDLLLTKTEDNRIIINETRVE